MNWNQNPHTAAFNGLLSEFTPPPTLSTPGTTAQMLYDLTQAQNTNVGFTSADRNQQILGSILGNASQPDFGDAADIQNLALGKYDTPASLSTSTTNTSTPTTKPTTVTAKNNEAQVAQAAAPANSKGPTEMENPLVELPEKGSSIVEGTEIAQEATEATTGAATALESVGGPSTMLMQLGQSLGYLMTNAITTGNNSNAQMAYNTAINQGHGYGYDTVAQNNLATAQANNNVRGTMGNLLSFALGPVGAAIGGLLPNAVSAPVIPGNIQDYASTSVSDSEQSTQSQLDNESTN